VVFDEDYFCRAATDRFDAYSAGAGKDVEEAGAADVGTEDVEERFAEAIAGGAEGVALQGFEDAAAVFAGDYAHLFVESYGGIGVGYNLKKKI
jgi:hypothetical protein